MTITATPRLGLNSWGSGADPLTRVQMDADNAALDLQCAIDLQGPLASRPAPGTQGRYYWATDTQQLFREDGTTWYDLNVSNHFRAKMVQLNAGTPQSVPSGTWTTLALDTIVKDVNGNCTTGAHAGYTCPVAGDYTVFWFVAFAPNSAGGLVLASAIWRNGEGITYEVSRAPEPNLVIGSTVPSTGSSDLITGCAAGDILHVGVYQNSGSPLATINTNPLCRFAVTLESR